jgi:hypothetical protein
MVKMKAENRGRQAWHDTVSQLAREGGAVPLHSPPKRRDTRKRVARQTKAASRWIADQGLDAADMTAWARVDHMLDAPKTSHLMAVDSDASDGGDYKEDSHSDVDMDEDERTNARRAKRKDAPKKKGKITKEKGFAPKRKKKRNPAEERKRQRHRQRSLPQVLLQDFAPSFSGADAGGADYVGAAARAPRPARRAHRVCVVTGKAAAYKDPNSGLPYSDMDAGALLRENPPPWLRLGKHGCAYHEAVLQIRGERAEAAPEREAVAAPMVNHDGSLLAPGQRPGDPDPPGWFRGRKFA